MRLGKAFGDPEKYAKLYPHSYEAGELRRGAYDLASFTPGHLHPDVHPPFQVPNDASLLLASPLRLTQTVSPLPPPFQTSLLASFANLTASSPSVSPLLSTLVAPSL